MFYFIGSISGDGRFKNSHLIQEFGQLCDMIGVKTGVVKPMDQSS